MLAAQGFVTVLAVYAAIGLLFAAAFVTRGMHRVDPAAIGAPIGFRLIILPGVAILWPWLRTRGRWCW